MQMVSRVFVLAALVMLTATSWAQDDAEPADMTGTWLGKFHLNTGDAPVDLRVTVTDASFTHEAKNGNTWQELTGSVTYFSQIRDTIMMGWLEAGGIWTENQSISMSYVNADMVFVIWTRHVTNRSADDDADGKPWFVQAQGFMHRAKAEKTEKAAE